jgi:hypothetical protein
MLISDFIIIGAGLACAIFLQKQGIDSAMGLKSTGIFLNSDHEIGAENFLNSLEIALTSEKK